MIKLIQLFMIVSFLFLSSSPPVFADQTIERVLIVFEDKIDESIVHQINGQVIHKYEQFHAVSAEVPENAIQTLLQKEGIVAIEKDKVATKQSQIIDWGITALNVPQAWNSTFTGKGVRIAVLDSGISSHPDLDIAGGTAFVSYTTSFSDDNGHGTHVAGIIGAKNNHIGTVGVAPNANLYAVKVLDYNGEGYVSDIAAGINWSIQNNMDIINLSLSTPEHSYLLKTAVDAAYKKGILVVAAAGNNGTPDGSYDTVEYPANYPSVIAVSAVTSTFERGAFSASGQNVEVTAPGIGITSTYVNNGYAKLNGTSMATPFVTGTIALMKNAYPDLPPSGIREQLRRTAIDLGTPGKDVFYGYGLVQAPMKGEKPVEPETQPGWNYDNGAWFYIDSMGNLVKGWLFDQQRWYYLDQHGIMQTGWLYENGAWYYLSNDGAMKTGWIIDNNLWYYLGPDGAMKSGWLLDKGSWYYLSQNGAMKTGWFQDWNKTWYYLNHNGAMKTGWLQIQHKWYFLDSSGAMLTGWKKIAGTWYYFYSSGEMAANTIVDGYLLGTDGAWIY